MDIELKFYTEILEEYNNSCSSEDGLFLWFCFSIIKLMNLTKNKKHSEIIRNGLILILDHYQGYQEHLVDISFWETESLIPQDNNIFMEALKQEFC